MASIKSEDTKPEMALRRALHARGLRYRPNAKGVPGRPDLLFPKFKAAVFVHGCFWHRHEGCRLASTPATRKKYWTAKFASNVVRDRTVLDELIDLGWRVATVWECTLEKPELVSATADRVFDWLKSDEETLEIE